MAGRPLRVVLVDDDGGGREVLAMLLRGDGIDVVGQGSTADDAVALVLAHHPDVALVDVHMPGSGIAATERITRLAPDVPVVMLTASDEQRDVLDALRAGALGYLVKDCDVDALGESLRGVVSGRAAVSPVVVSRLLDEFRAPSRPHARRSGTAAARLTPREWDVMDLLLEGLSNDEVAQRLFLSTTTVRVHVSSVVRKLRVADREQALELLRVPV